MCFDIKKRRLNLTLLTANHRISEIIDVAVVLKLKQVYD